MEETKEKRIIDFLKEKGEASMSRISVSTGINFYDVEEIVSELVSKDVLEFVQKKRGNYYKIKEEKK